MYLFCISLQSPWYILVKVCFAPKILSMQLTLEQYRGSSEYNLSLPSVSMVPPHLYINQPQTLQSCVVLCLVASVMSDSLRPYGLQPARLLCPWHSPGKNTGVGCHFPLQSIFPTQGQNPSLKNHHLLSFLHWQEGSLPLAPLGSPYNPVVFSVEQNPRISEAVQFRPEQLFKGQLY